MATCIAHEPCPKCDSRDNLGRYDDGSAYCFGCGHWEPPTNRIRTPLEPPRMAVELPNDLTSILPSPNRDWLLKYGLNEHEISQFQYSSRLQRHLYIVLSERGEVFFEARSVARNATKSIQTGTKPYHIILEANKNPLVLVEDVVSAIKVGRQTACLPLFGASLSQEFLLRVTKEYATIIVWLDKDKYSKGIEIKHKIQNLGVNSRVVRTNKDPKELSDKEIKEILDSN